jgi:23S rRNA (adenine2503-C2)-methyltransferase
MDLPDTSPPSGAASAQKDADADAEAANFYDLDRNQLLERMRSDGLPAYRGEQILRWAYERRVTSWEAMTDLPLGLRQSLAAGLSLELPAIVRVTGSHDITRKYLFRFPSGDLVESVLIPASPALYGGRSDRRTLCLSSQVGCAYGCKFCASGLDGWKRNLSPGEIVGQFLAVEAHSGQKINNIVFMGMGEPLANYESLMKAIDHLNAPWGVGLGARHMTISTSGLVPRILDLAAQPRQVRLAISLHGASNAVRERIMPVNRKYPLEQLLSACAEYVKQKKQRLSFEYILIAGVNDTTSDAHDLVRVARPLQAKINLIPYNRVEGLEWERPEESVQDAFLGIVRRGGVAATIRREKGHDIDAACGQLRLTTLKETAA